MAFLDPSTASISLNWGVDDGGQMFLNGNLVSDLSGQVNTNWNFSHSALLNSGFVSGTNTLQIVFNANDNFFEGVNVQIVSATANPIGTVPEPSLLSLLIAGLGTVVFFRHRALHRA
jgi:hypothetical protein